MLWPLRTIRSRLALLVLLVVVPAILLSVRSALERSGDISNSARDEVRRIALLINNNIERSIEANRRFLAAVAELPAITAGDAATCNKSFARLLAAHPDYLNVGACSPDGLLFASALPFAAPLDLSDRLYFRRAVETRGFSVGEFQVGRVTKKRSLNFACPTPAQEGIPSAVVYLAMDLEWINRLFTDIRLPENSVGMVLDHGGTVLACHPHSDDIVGRPFSEPDILRLGELAGRNAFEFVGRDRVRRLWSMSCVASLCGNMLIGVGIPVDALMAPNLAQMHRNIAIMAGVGVMVLLVAWIGSASLILSPLRKLLSAVREIERGRLCTRIGERRRVPAELLDLETAFDRMVESLHVSDRKLKRSEKTLRTLSMCNQGMIRETDERRLLKTFCETIVREGGYRMAWVGFAEKDGDKLVRPVASAGFEEGYLETLRITWADTEIGRGPTGTAVRTGRPTLCRDMLTDPMYAPWRENAIERGYRSSIALPVELPHGGGMLGALNIYSSESDAFDADEQALLQELALDLGFGIAAIRTTSERKDAEEKVKRSRDELRALYARLERVREDERTALSRELHDEMGQLLTAMKLNLAWIDDNMPGGHSAQVRERVAEMGSLADTVMTTIGRIASQLRPGVLDDLGFVAAVDWLAEDFTRRTGITCEVSATSRDIALDRERATAFFRITQESLTNVAKHAGATRVDITIVEKDNTLAVGIEDNGRGYCSGQTAGSASLGIVGMRERAAGIGGTLLIESPRGGGAIVTVEAPLKPARM